MTPPRSGHDARALHQRAGLALRAFPQQRPQVVITDRATTTSLSRTCKNCLSFCSWARVARKATPVALRGFLVALSLACLGACRVAGGAQSHFRRRAKPRKATRVALRGFARFLSGFAVGPLVLPAMRVDKEHIVMRTWWRVYDCA